MEIQSQKSQAVFQAENKDDLEQDYFTFLVKSNSPQINFTLPFPQKPLDSASVVIDNFTLNSPWRGNIVLQMDTAQGFLSNSSANPTAIIAFTHIIAVDNTGVNFYEVYKNFQTKIDARGGGQQTIRVGEIDTNYNFTLLPAYHIIDYFTTQFTIGYFYKN